MVELYGSVSVSHPKGMNCSRREIGNYVRYVNSNIDGTLDSLKIIPEEDGLVKLDYTVKHREFERIRRITGYLTGVLNSWNDAKRAEEKDRVKHEIG